MASSFGRLRRLTALAVSVFLASAAGAQVAPLWEVEGSTVGSYWRTVALGNYGTQVVTNLDGGSCSTSLLAAGGTLPGGTPLVWTASSNATTRRSLAASSLESDVHASFVFEQVGASTGWRPRLTVRRASSNVPLFQFLADPVVQSNGLPPSGVFVDDRGQRCLVWWYSAGTSQTHWRCFTTAGAQVSGGTLPVAGIPRGAVASGDLSELMVMTSLGLIHVDPLAGAMVGDIPNHGIPTGNGAISRDGRRFVQANTQGGVEFYENVGGAFVYRRTVGTDATYAVHAVALSGDGRYLATGAFEIQQQRHLRVRLRDLSTAGDPVVLADDLVGGGSLTAYVTDLEMDTSARLLAIGTTGDATNAIPELVVHERQADGTYRRTPVDLAGSVFDLALGPRTRTLLVSSAQAQVYSLYEYRARLTAFDLGADLRAVGTPTSASTCYVDAKAAPGTRTLLLASSALAATPGPFRNMGIMNLDTPVVSSSVVANGSGIARHTLALPADPALIGTTVYLQGLRLEPRRLSECVLAVSVLP